MLKMAVFRWMGICIVAALESSEGSCRYLNDPYREETKKSLPRRFPIHRICRSAQSDMHRIRFRGSEKMDMVFEMMVVASRVSSARNTVVRS